MSWDNEEENKELGNTERVYEIQEELERRKEEFFDLKEQFIILEPRAVSYRKAIGKWYPNQIQFLSTSRKLLAELREGYGNAVDPSDKLDDGLNEMCSLEENTGSKFKNRVGNVMLQTLEDYIKDCKSHSRSVDKWQKSCSSVEHYIKKVLELSTNLNVANNTGKDKLAKKLLEKFKRNEYKLNTTAKEHIVTHDEVKAELTKFWDERVDFFDNICKDLLFWQQTFLTGHGEVIVKSLQSLGLSSYQIDQGAEAVMKQKKPSKKENAGGKEDEKDEDNVEDAFNDDDVQWADEPANPYAGW